MAQDELKQVVATNTTLTEQPEALRALFEKFSQGETPNFLEMMGAISGLVAFSTDSDTAVKVFCPDPEKRSGKKCLFCS